MTQAFLHHIGNKLDDMKSSGLYKVERQLTSPQSGQVRVLSDLNGSAKQINLCANNYLGLANHPALIKAAQTALDEYGYGMASVRFICGTQELHRKLEQRLADYLGKDDAILFAACFDANGGLFEPLLNAEDAIISDSLNHASIIDGIRLSKAQKYRYQSGDMADLETQLQAARDKGARHIMIATDGVFSMDGTLADLQTITSLADTYNALVMVDDCHGTGFMGPTGQGTAAHLGVNDKVDILTGTLGKALGGAIGGYIAGPQQVIDLLRQTSRPYLFSNALPPSVCAASLAAIELAEKGDELRQKLFENAAYWRSGLSALGFALKGGEHPIIPIMLGEADYAQAMARRLQTLNIFVTGFFYPVVPQGTARIRTQMSAALTSEDLDKALDAFAIAGREIEVIS